MATERMQQELPVNGCRYQKSVWVPQRKTSGETTSIYAGVEIETLAGETAELSRELTLDEIEQSQRGGGFQAIVKLLAEECYAELQAQTAPVEIPVEVVAEAEQEIPVLTSEAPEPMPEDVDWVLAGIEVKSATKDGDSE